MSITRLGATALALTLAAAGAAPAQAGARFQGLGVLSEAARTPFSNASDVSDDGCVVVGRGSRGTPLTLRRAVRWEGGTPIELPGGRSHSRATAVSGDGSVAVGFSHGAIRWEDGVAHRLGGLGGGSGLSTFANGVSEDGSVIVGQARRKSGGHVAFRWEGGVMEDLGRLPGGTGASGASAVSADGSVVVGGSHSPEGNQAFRWEAGTMTALGTLPGAHFLGSEAVGLSPDGSVVVGVSGSAEGILAFRWEGGVMRALGELPEGPSFAMTAADASTDGSLVVGCGVGLISVSCVDGVVWNEAGEAQHVEELLRAFGLGPHIEGWALREVTAVSPDARTLVGSGISPAGREEAWIASSPTGFDRPAPAGAGSASFHGGETPPGRSAPPRCGRPWAR